MKFAKIGKLPGKPSQLIKLALKDLVSVERSSAYRVNMSYFHTNLHGASTKCEVCFAGAVMARTLGCAINTTATPDYFFAEKNALNALDMFRRGWIDAGLELMGLQKPTSMPSNVHVDGYLYDKKQFKNAMRQVVKILEKAGY